MIKIILIVLAVIYMIYASENGAFPIYNKKEDINNESESLCWKADGRAVFEGN